jgi:histidinol-phosphate aminotransferase
MIKPRKSVAVLEPYIPPLEGRRGRVRLDFNENTAPPEVFGGAVGSETVSVYPEYGPLIEKLEKFFRVEKGCVMPVAGSGEGLFLIAFTFIEPGRDKALTSKPTFALIPHTLRVVGSKLVEIGVTEGLDFDVAAIRKELDRGVKVAVFASPDNPTGARLSVKTMRTFAKKYPKTLFAVDEAYGEYAGESIIPLTRKYPNLLVLKTFSKAWGLAGLRIGVIIGNENLLREMRKVRSPYSVNAAAVHALAELLGRYGEIRKSAKSAVKRKKCLVAEVKFRGFKTHDGSGNFFLVAFGADSSALCNFARTRGVLVRDRSAMYRLSGFARITVGTAEENRRFIETLDAFNKERAVIFDLDDTLVDTSGSYDAAVMELVKRRSGKPFSRGALLALRAEGGYNNDWDAAAEALKRRGVKTNRKELGREGREIYFSLARKSEKSLIDFDLLKRLKNRARLFIWTGRKRDEYEPFWKSTLGRYFEKAYCSDDFRGVPPKPAPDQILRIMRKHGIKGGYYIGNSVDDMRAAVSAGLVAVGVTTTLAVETLASAGAALVLKNVNDLEKVFQI